MWSTKEEKIMGQAKRKKDATLKRFEWVFEFSSSDCFGFGLFFNGGENAGAAVIFCVWIFGFIRRQVIPKSERGT